MPAWVVVAIVLGFFVVFPLFWCAVVWLVGVRWRSLAAEFSSPWPPPPTARLFHGQSAVLGWTRYNRVLTIAVTPDAIHLRPIAIFAVGHPALSIPWERFGVPREAGLFKGTGLLSAPVRRANGREMDLRLPRPVWAASPLAAH